MPTPGRIFVLSDLHLGLGDVMAIFHAGDALRRFLEWCAARPEPAQLVILGDALDYLQLAPWERADEDTAVTKTRALLAANRDVFAALRPFVAARSPHTLVWCIGNHDLELAYPSVRALIEAELGGAPQWRTGGEPLDHELPGGAVIRLVHGNAPDPFNRVDYARLAACAAAGDITPAYPHGSRLVARVFNPLKQSGYRYIDLLKPEERVALPLTLSLWPDDALALLRAAFPVFTRAELDRVADALGDASTAGERGADLEAAAPTAEDLVLRSLLEPVLADSDLGTADLLDWCDAPSPFDPGSRGLRDVAAALLRGAARRHAALDPFDPFGPDDVAAALESAARERVVLLVAGHTHLARAHERDGLYYLNTGTWADLMRLPPNLSRDLVRRDLEQLRAHLRTDAAADPLPSAPPWLAPFRRLTFADIEISGPRWRAHLCQWPEDPIPRVASLP